MLEQGSPFSDQSAYILVAAGPQDTRAIALVQALRNAGLRITYAETVNIATRASEAAACVVILRPDTWKAQNIATIMRSKPAFLLPVLAEPMELPRGPWTQDAITLTNETGDAEQKLIQTLQEYLATRPQSSLARYTQNKKRDPKPLSLKRRRSRNAHPLITLILVLLILGLAGSLIYRFYLKPQANQGTQTSNGSLTNTATRYRTYTAHTPGSYCDNGGGQWSQADRYMKDKKTEVIDKYTTSACQSNGLLITRSGDYDFFSEIFFDGIDPSSSIAQHYSVQIDATIVSGDAQAAVTLDVHIPDQSYGRYGFDINTLGHWEADTDSTVDGSPLKQLALGFWPKTSHTFTLRAEVNGPLMTFSINGTQVTSVTDTTFPDNSAIAFGVNDITATKPISALFSNFKYQELPPTDLSQQNIIATATGQALTNNQTIYKASVPGYGCDHGAGQWQPLADEDTTGTLQCTANGMQLTIPANTDLITEENFYWLNGHFPQNYKITAQINVQDANDRCAALGTRGESNGGGGGYFFIVCADGSWKIILLNDTFQTLAQGTIQAQDSYQVTATSDGANQSLSIDGTLIQTVKDSTLTTTDHVSLAVGLYKNDQQATAVFSNFSFTPLA